MQLHYLKSIVNLFFLIGNYRITNREDEIGFLYFNPQFRNMKSENEGDGERQREKQVDEAFGHQQLGQLRL